VHRNRHTWCRRPFDRAGWVAAYTSDRSPRALSTRLRPPDFASVERAIGALHESGGGVARRERGHADTDREGADAWERVTLKVGTQARSEGIGCPDVAQWEDHHELFAPHRPAMSGWRHASLHDLAQLEQRSIARFVAVVVVDHLEVVEIEQQHR
jgi:hypothetical protein